MNKPLRITADEKIPWVKDFFKGIGSVRLFPGEEITNSSLSETDILLVRTVTKVNSELLKDTPVSYVASATIGFDHLDTEFLDKHQIKWTSAPGCNASAVAQYVMSAVFALQKNPEQKTLGIIGAGNVGSSLHRYAKTLGWKTILCDPPLQERTKSDLYQPLSKLLNQSDIISIHTPLTASGNHPTKHMVCESFLEAMKPDSLLINTARGNIVHQESLLKHRDKLSALVLDVWPDEPNISQELLRVTDIATPHIAGYSTIGKLNATHIIFNKVKQHFQIEADNPIERVLKQIDHSYISVHENTAISKVIHSVFPIQQTHQWMINAIKDSSETRKVFENLRKTYTFRKEYSQFSLKPHRDVAAPILDILENLGFKKPLKT